jgi:hypothetical protein
VIANEMEARDFIISLAVHSFNRQKKTNYDAKDFEIINIENTTSGDYAFEIYSSRFDDYFRMRLYCSLGNINRVSNYQLQEEYEASNGVVNKVFVADALLDNEFLHSDNNFIRRSFPKFEPNSNLLNVLLHENGQDGILLEDNSYLILETDGV